MKDIPVVLTCYNRPQHTAQVLTSLRRHNIQNLYIFSDAPRTPKDNNGILATRQLLKSITWTRPTILCRETNLGLAKSIISAVNYVFNKHDRMVLLEDDCVPGPFFFDFMAKCLSKYEENQKIFGINGYTVPIPDDLLKNYPFDVYFYPRIGSWGWATWKRAWAHFDPDLSGLYSRALAEGIDLCQAGPDIPSQVRRVLGGQLDAWTLNWVLTVYLNKGCYIYPTVSQIENIGLDGSGVHSGTSSRFENPAADKQLTRFPDEIILNKDLTDNYNKYFGPKSAVAPTHGSRPGSAAATDCQKPDCATEQSRPKLSIVHVNTHDAVGGAAKVGWRLAEEQRKVGHVSKMLVGSKKSNSIHSFAFPPEIDKSLYESCLKRGQLFYAAQAGYKLIENGLLRRADIMHLHNLHGGYFNPFALSVLSHFKPVVWTLHDMQAFTGHCAHSFDCQRWLDGCRQCPHLDYQYELSVDTSGQLLRDKRLIYDHSHLWLVAPSQWLKNKIERSVLRDQPVELIYNGVDTNVFKPCDKKEARAKFGITTDTLVIGAVSHGGTFANHWKGGRFTKAALDALHDKLPNCVFVNIGTSTRCDDPRIIDIPHIENENELARAYSALDIFLYTPLADNCPLVVLEALACGVPVVSFDTGGVPELVRDGLDGFVTEYRNVPQIVHAVKRLAEAPALLAAQGRNGRQWAVENFDHRITSRRYEDLYRRVLAKNETTKRTVNLFPLTKVPDVVKTEAFMQAEKSKAGIVAKKPMPAPTGVDTSGPQIDVSIILCTKDRAALLEHMLASLKQAAEGVTWEIIVVEGASSDNTLDVLGQHGVKNVYDETQCLGPGRHTWPQLYNFGFSKARGKWAIYASDDIVLSKGCISRAVELLNRQKREVAGGIFFFKNTHARPDWDRFGIDFTLGPKLLMNYGLVRLDLFRAVGGLDEAYRFYCADGDLCLKLYEAGWQFIPLPGCFVVHDNVLDAAKKTNAENSNRDIELYIQRWKHFVSPERPEPRRLLWHNDFTEAFNLPIGLAKINSGIEHFWYGLACYRYSMFERAKLNFLQTLQSGCEHWLVLWYLAKAARECGDETLAEKAAEAVLRIKPDFLRAKDLLTSLRSSSEFQPPQKPMRTRIQKDTDTSTVAHDLLKNIKVHNDSPVFDDVGFDNSDCRTNGEGALIRCLIKPGDVVFDIGANTGQWSSMVLSDVGKVRLHSFEPVTDTFALLKINLGSSGAHLHNIAISANNGSENFYHYNRNAKLARMSSFYRRNNAVEQQFNTVPVPVSVQAQTLDSFCEKHSISRVDFVKIDTEGAELDVLRGAANLLHEQRIKIIQFEYGGTYPDAGITLHQVCRLLSSHNCVIFRILHDGIVHMADWRDSLENNRYSNYLAVSASVAGSYNIMQNLHTKKTQPDHDLEEPAGAPAPFFAGPETDVLSQIKDARLWSPEKHLRLHLGCGKWHFDGYINIDYPPQQHNVVTKLGADLYADIKKLNFPAQSVDEIRLHHVFEHFDRPTALALLIEWHEWLKTGGTLRIETPDLIGSAKTLLSDASLKTKMGVARHLAGDQADKWAYHTEHWFAERFENTLAKLGFGPVRTQTSSWPHEPYLSNVQVVAVKKVNLKRDQLLAECDKLLLDSLVADATNEMAKHKIWMRRLRKFLDENASYSSETPYTGVEVAHPKKEPSDRNDLKTETVGLIFSKDRPMQLAATIESFFLHCSDNQNIKLNVLYKASGDFYRARYDTLKNAFADITFIEETDFKAQTLAVISEYEYVLFLVDDNLFVKDFNLADIVGLLKQNHNALAFSLRLGRNTTYSYTRNARVNLPPFWYVDKSVLKYDWTRGRMHFAYPLELSSSIYRTEDILELLKKLDFGNPNMLEGLMDANKQIYAGPRAALLCYEQSAAFCNPVNMVQNVSDNRAGCRPEYSADSLAEMFDRGLRIDVGRYDGFVPNSPHQEVQFEFVEPKGENRPDEPLVSVEMIAYNAQKYIAEAVDSILAQTYKNFELIIVDDGSSDKTKEIVDSYSDSRIRYIHKEHKNRWSGTNVAIARANGKYIITVDSDDFIAPDYIEKLVACAGRYPDIDYFYPPCLTLVDQFGKPTGQRWDYLDFADNKTLPNFLFEHAYSPIPHPGGLKRKSMYDRVGGYQELENAADFVFLCRNSLKMSFKRLDDSPAYFYRLLPTSLSHKFKARNQITADILNEMVSIYPPEMLCTNIGRIAEPALKRRQYYKYLMDTFYKHVHGHMVKFGDYFRRYGDYYKQKLLNSAAAVNNTAGAAAASAKCPDVRELFKNGVELLKADKPDHALACFDEIYHSGGIIPDLQYARAIALTRLGRMHEAEKACRTQLNLQKNHNPAIELLQKISESSRAAKGDKLMQKISQRPDIVGRFCR